ncbi:hypothetical protein [Halarcobacter bivalviorum]|uniref:Uncharacterized protein n=1 Tax=Halarcobacter bivalviorum TaxID=663364 RepID=A0AAX2A8U9_9BACT|nr:hypothetical protein [Halarcobacter bivalviorum]AXH12572.1 hypothetical protein ABIV_1581 [Halarcobacter bivalviorum]RXK10503.1 hypothetical protein CRV05_04290 [Halarcobacter bivalviorum]
MINDNLDSIIIEVEKLVNESPYEITSFPSKKRLKEKRTHLIMFLEQAKNILNDKEQVITDFIDWEKDKKQLLKLLIDDIKLYLSENNLKTSNTLVFLTQTIITSDALFHISKSNIYKNAYSSIDLLSNNSQLDFFSIPFKIRLAIENKIKEIIGFKSCSIKRNGKEESNSQKIPITLVLNELKGVKSLKLPCSVDDITNIYIWSCNFCHTAQKEYIWTILKAFELLYPLFDYELKKRNEFSMYDFWKNEGLSENEISDNIIKYKGTLYPILYFEKPSDLKDLEFRLNNSRNNKLKPYTFNLSLESVSDIVGFYSSKNNKFY